VSAITLAPSQTHETAFHPGALKHRRLKQLGSVGSSSISSGASSCHIVAALALFLRCLHATVHPVYSTSEKYVIVCYDVYELNLKIRDLIDEPLLFCKHERPKTMFLAVWTWIMVCSNTFSMGKKIDLLVTR
jgi:hypothetical protein